MGMEVGEKGTGVGEMVRVMEEEGMEEVGVGMGGSTSRGILDFRNQSKRWC
jgi:glycerate kinase